ncbi:GTP-binding protein [Bacteroidetes bacterium UKL13-3]|jgi:GTP-binding protein|nr:GTP-binding protein [Bacteroidetes bacterium UKL13-3]HCP93208.1 YihA family ribosome biogenesis GTP-binding protein [Bacteroidota bacterium]
MEVRKAVFVKSAEKIIDCPNPDKPEYAFIGRSNVGKSSLINMLVSKPNLARVSANPGKTITINHYIINDNWFLVDLPGYGYARRSKTMRGEWEHSLEEYLKERENLQCLFVLIDSRIDPQDSDLEFLNFLGNLEVPFSIVFTKIDKLNQSMRAKNMKAFTDEVLKNWEVLPPVFQTSAVEKKGRDKILKYIEEVNGQFVKPTF